jgi:hypothetical protein
MRLTHRYHILEPLLLALANAVLQGIFVYFIAGRNARVIQAHYEKGKFIIQKTKHISFEEENIDDFKLSVWWIMNVSKPSLIFRNALRIWNSS